MSKKNPIITGTLVLTVAGLITRIIGFFNRIYLSQLIGAKEMGVYQLIFPVYMVCFSLCCHGTELALPQMVAQFYAKEKKPSIRPLIFTASIMAIALASLLSYLLFTRADFISVYILKEKNCAVCLRFMAPILPFTALRCCLHGYYIGLKKTFVPAMGQLIEQVTRVGAIWLVASHYASETSFTASLAVIGMIAGEVCGTLYTYISYQIQSRDLKFPLFYERDSNMTLGRKLLSRTVPLTGNKLSLTLVSALESILIPFMLTYYYKDKDLALSMYGVLTGMALPFITFPSTITNSLSVMLLPAISEANALHHTKRIIHTIEKTVKLCLTIGFTALIFFFFFGRQLGTYVFHNPSAGDFLFILSFLCPFLYLSSASASILNGLGFMKETFFYNLVALLIRILFIVGLVPLLGVQGYLLGLLAAYFMLVILQLKKIKNSISPTHKELTGRHNN